MAQADAWTGGVAVSDLFNPDRALTPAERRDIQRKGPRPRGHVMPPGTGPAGETCGSCLHLHRNHLAKTYLKCGLNQAKWTGGGASDVRAKDAACKKWETNPAKSVRREA